jgi:hypothetical protein
MDGIKLLTAARVIAKAGEQIEAMIEILEEKLIEALTDKKENISAVHWSCDGEYSEGGWIYKSYLWNIALQKGRSKKPHAHIAIQVVLYDEDELQISGWEPSLYIMYGPGEEAFNLEDSLWLSSAKKDGWNLDGNRLWRWKEEDEEGWGFVLSLVKLNSEEALEEQIVEPVKKLLERFAPSDPFPSNSVAFRFTEGNDGINILV